MVVDATGDIPINPLAAPHAYIYGMQVTDVTTGAIYRVYPPPATQPLCTVGGNCQLGFGIQNDGTGPGTIYLTVTRLDTNQVLHNQQYTLAMGQQQQIPDIIFVMPNATVSIRVEVGHI